jgi:hypothetical protein
MEYKQTIVLRNGLNMRKGKMITQGAHASMRAILMLGHQDICAERELLAEETRKEHLQVREEGKRQVKRALEHYDLEVVLVVGYRRRLRSVTSASISASEFHRSPRWLRS